MTLPCVTRGLISFLTDLLILQRYPLQINDIECMKRIILFVFLTACVLDVVQAQTPLITDGRMMPVRRLGNGLFYTCDSWKAYWEGTLKRDNQNIGTLTTQSAAWMGAYGLHEKVTLIATLPYVWTSASGGTLTGMQGLQDLTVAAKYNFFKKAYTNSKLNFFALGSFSIPLSNYSVDLLPLSIGMGTKDLSARLTAAYSFRAWYVNASGAYTWRSNVSLDRPSYYTNGQQYSTSEVKMYDLFDLIIRAGYGKENWHAEIFYTQQNTLGGGDIRRQDMPFVSNQMNANKVGALVMWSVPQIKKLALRAWSTYTVDGRNVGQSFSITAGLMYHLDFSKDQQN